MLDGPFLSGSAYVAINSGIASGIAIAIAIAIDLDLDISDGPQLLQRLVWRRQSFADGGYENKYDEGSQ